MKRILLATDGSDLAEGAQRLAIDWCRHDGANLIAMTSMMTLEDLEGVGTHRLRETLEREAQSTLDAVSAAARQVGVECTTRLVYGESPDQAIITAAAETGADLVVMGRRGGRGLARAMVGHATDRVAGRAPCDVLVVPKSAAMFRNRLLLATDGSACSIAALRAGLRIAREFHLSMRVVSATREMHSDARRAEACASVDTAVAEAKRAGIDVDGAVEEGRPDAVIIRNAAESGADLIVIGSHGRTGLASVVLGSISGRVIGQASCAVLVARPPH